MSAEDRVRGAVAFRLAELDEELRDAQAALMDALAGLTDDDWRDRAACAIVVLESVRHHVADPDQIARDVRTIIDEQGEG